VSSKLERDFVVTNSIAIIGSTGTNSQLWTDTFLKAGWSVRNLVRDPAHLVPQRGQTGAAFNLDDFAGFGEALSRVHVLALVTPADPRQVDRETELIAAAKRVGVARIIKVSVLGADLSQPISQFARWSGQIEKELAAAKVPYVVLRANLYMQNLLRQRQSIEAGSYVEPLGATRVTMLDVRDTAEVAVAVANGGYDGKALSLTGPEALAGPEVAAILSEATGHPVRFVSPDLESFKAALLSRGMPAWRLESQMELYGAVLGGRAPHLAAISSDVLATIGRPARTLKEFARSTFTGA
jgi:uncharacterized protein YbjT (DUF2867 family)